MNSDMLITIVTLAAALVLFASDRLRMDLVALLALLALMVTGVLSPAKALAGFAAPVVVLIAALFVVSEGISATGLAARLSNGLGRLTGSSATRLLVVCMGATALMSAFMSSTGAVALMLPVVLTLCHEVGTRPSRILMPMAFAASLGGLLTLIGTPPNLVVSDALRSAGLEEFEFFGLTPVGALMLAGGIAFMVFAGRRLLPDRTHKLQPDVKKVAAVSASQMLKTFELEEQIHWLRVRRMSPLAGKTIQDADLAARYEVAVLGVRSREDPERPSERPATAGTVLPEDAVLVVRGMTPAVQEFASIEKLDILPRSVKPGDLVSESVGFTEVLVLPRSSLIGRSLRETRFSDRYGVYVIGIHRAGREIRESIGDARLEVGDTMLVQGTWKAIAMLGERSHDFLVTGVPKELAQRRLERMGRRAPLAAVILLVMVVVMCLGVTSAVTVALSAALAMVLTRCVPLDRVYRSINWESLVLIAAMLPMATALDDTGATEKIVAGLVSALGDLGSYGVMAGFFVLTSLMSLVVSNTATTVIIAPVAIQVGLETGSSPRALMMIVAVAASAAFATPMASPINALVMGPGDYRFGDFLKLGLPLQLLVMALSLLVIPLLF